MRPALSWELPNGLGEHPFPPTAGAGGLLAAEHCPCQRTSLFHSLRAFSSRQHEPPLHGLGPTEKPASLALDRPAPRRGLGATLPSGQGTGRRLPTVTEGGLPWELA